MTRRVFFASIFLCGAPLALAIDCQSLSPYPSVYDQVYEAGHQSASPGGGGGSTGDGGGGDGEVTDDCPPGTSRIAVTTTPWWLTLDTSNVYWTTLPSAAATDSSFGGFASTGTIESIGRKSTSTTSNMLVTGLTGAMIITTASSYLAYSAVGEAAGSDMGIVGLASTPSGTGATTPGASLTSPFGVAIDASNVYWVSQVDGTAVVMSAPLGGGAATTLGTASGYSLGQGLSVSGGTLYLAASLEGGSGGAILTLPTSGPSTPTPLQTSSTWTPWDVRTDATNVYWDDHTGGGVYQSPLAAGGTVTTLASGLTSPDQLAVDMTNVYAVESTPGGKILEMTIGSSGTPKTLAMPTDTIPGGVAADNNDTYVYFSMFSSNSICKVSK
jgi:hypothetical protein